MLKFLKRMMGSSSPSKPDYEILKCKDKGFVAVVNLDLFGKYAISDDGSEGVSLKSAHDKFFSRGYFVPTVEEAGQRINKHAANKNMEKIWES